MSNFTGFVYGVTRSTLERQQKPLTEEEIILQAHIANRPEQEKAGLSRRVRDLVRQSLDRLTRPAEEPALERITNQS